jgi:hypothetical protein
MSRESLLTYARSQLGYIERPKNRTKYGRQFGEDGVFWCMIFVWCCFENSGNHGVVPKTDSTRALFDAAQRGELRMQWLRPSVQPVPGDLAEFDMGGPEPVNHIGIVERRLADGRLVCIEGNTGGRGPSGERNGGMVARKVRNPQAVVNFVRPNFDSTGTLAMPSAPPFPGRIIRRGDEGPVVKRIQARLNVIAKGKHGVLGGKPLPVGGHFGPQTESVVKVFQQHRNLADDGKVGRQTWGRLFP